MPTVVLSKAELLKMTGKLSDEKLKDRISMLGTDLESIEGDAVTVEVFPNRPDLLSQQGFARALANFLGKKKVQTYDVKKSGHKVLVEEVPMRPYTACAIVKGVEFNDERIREVMQVQEKLAMTHGRARKKSAYGLYPLETISFPVTYTAKDPKTVTFRPLGLPSAVRADTIEEVHPKGKEYKHIAEKWKEYPFFIDAKENVLSMLPYTNSHETGKIDTQTKDVFIECTGTNQANVDIALAILATSLADIGGQIYTLDVVYKKNTLTTPDLQPKAMELDASYINGLLGLQLSQQEIHANLEKMGFSISKGKVLIPAYRGDILHQADLAEDVAIAYGYENILEELPTIATTAGEHPLERKAAKIRERLIGHGFVEVKNYNLIGKETQTKKMRHMKKVKHVLHSVSEEYDSLRAWVLPSLLETFQRNKRHEYPQRIFEIGTTFGKKEEVHLAVAICGDEIDYTSIRQILDDLATGFGTTYQYKPCTHASFIPGRVATVKEGFIGEIAPEVLISFGLEMPVSAFELSLE